MQIVCPVCNAKYALEAALSDVDARQAVVEMGRMPPPAAKVALAYIGLFRPAKSALSWRRTGKLLGELADMLAAGGIRRKGRAWKLTVNDFIRGFEAVLSRREKLVLPLKNHGYLEEVLVGIANKQEGQEENQTETQRRKRHHEDLEQPTAKPINHAEIAEKKLRAKWDAELGLKIDQGATRG